MERFRRQLEYSAFGVCSYIGQRMGITTTRVRLYFIYISCLTLGSPILFYLFTAFWLNVRSYIRKGKNIVFQ